MPHKGINSCWSRVAPTINIKLALTSNDYRRSSPESEKPYLSATSTLSTPSILTLELRGEFDSGTILVDGFRAEHFNFYDLTTSLPVVKSPFPGTCEPRVNLRRDGVVEIHSSKPHGTSRQLEDMSPKSDPVRSLEVGHEYRITLKPQEVWCCEQSAGELFGTRESIPVEDLPDGMMAVLASDDVLMLKVEA